MTSYFEFPVQGTWDELNQIRSAISKAQAARSFHDREYERLQKKQQECLRLIKQKAQSALQDQQLEFPDA